YNHLTNLGFECLKPQGAFYLFPKSPIKDDKKFCNELKKFNILAVPGSVFGCDGYFRLSYCISYEKIKKSLKAFEKVAELFNDYL
ncbi:aminotransferase class I/II-fold pyridoxal phosphate-dependent enzyme, partial [Clostridium saudiense]|nr:aminotransferase class I/II-fold pyridoxal phosphate-dependent enzyme [Clostridium saudiense]